MGGLISDNARTRLAHFALTITACALVTSQWLVSRRGSNNAKVMLKQSSDSDMMPSSPDLSVAPSGPRYFFSASERFMWWFHPESMSCSLMWLTCLFSRISSLPLYICTSTVLRMFSDRFWSEPWRVK